MKISNQQNMPPAMSKQQIADMLKQRKSNYSLPQAFYNGADVYDAEMDEIWCREWLFAGLTCEIPIRGNYLTLEIGNNPIMLVRGKQGEVRAFHNVCRHRGSKICLKERGKVGRLVCPYHKWTYELSGDLIFAGNQMGDSFNPADFPLHPVHCRTAGGYIFISLAENPPEIDKFLQDLAHYLEPHDLDNAKVAFESTLIEDANWKLVVENNRECFHCKGSHPELLNTLLEWDDVIDPRVTDEFKEHLAHKAVDWDFEQIPHTRTTDGNRNRIVRMPLSEGAISMTIDGKAACQKLMGRFQNPDMGSMRYYHMPNSWNHAMGDHLIAFQILPLGPQKTQVTTKWLVHKDAVEGVDYDPERMRKVWDVTNNQDRLLAENNQRGINSIAYRPGPYSETYEFGVMSFLDWYSEVFQRNQAEN